MLMVGMHDPVSASEISNDLNAAIKQEEAV